VTGVLGDSCTTAEDCSAVIGHSRCDDVSMTCVCDVIAGYWRTEYGTCGIRKYTMPKKKENISILCIALTNPNIFRNLWHVRNCDNSGKNRKIAKYLSATNTALTGYGVIIVTLRKMSFAKDKHLVEFSRKENVTVNVFICMFLSIC